MKWFEAIFYAFLYSYVGIGFGYLIKKVSAIYSLKNQIKEKRELVIQEP